MKTKKILLLGVVFLLALGFVGVALAGANYSRPGTAELPEQNLIVSSQEGAFSVEGGFPPADVLLVDDDDNTPDVLSIYTQILGSLGVSYTVWDTVNSDFEPDLATLNSHRAVVWFTGDAFGGNFVAGPGPAAEADLSLYLDEGGCMFMSSQDYFYDRGQIPTPFMQNYLGMANSVNDAGDYVAVTGQGTVFSGLGPYSLVYPFTDYSDIVIPDPTAQLAFIGENANGAAIHKNAGTYKTTFLGFPLEAIPSPFDQQQVVGRFLRDCFPDDIMLVDDSDLNPPVAPYYFQALSSLGYSFNVWGTDNSDYEPTANDLIGYEAVVWFTGDEDGGSTGPGSQSEVELSTWLDSTGGCLFLSSQDYLFARGLTPFITNYLGAASGIDVGQTVVTGTYTYGGLGPFVLNYPFTRTTSDAFDLSLGAVPAFVGDRPTLADSHAAGIIHTNGSYQTTWLGFPFEALPTVLDQRRTMNHFLANCFETDLQTSKATSDPVVDVGQTFSYTVQVVNNGPHRAVDVLVTDFIPEAVTVNNVISTSGACTLLGSITPAGDLLCTIPNLEVGQTELIELTVTANLPGAAINFVFATNFGADVIPSNNSTSRFVFIEPPSFTDLFLHQVTPHAVPATTGGSLLILGVNFEPGTQIFLDNTELLAFSFDVDNPDAILSATLPPGLPPGIYDLKAENPGGEFDVLEEGVVIYDPNALTIEAIDPGYGPNDLPVIINIYGQGFSPNLTGKLIDPNNSTNIHDFESVVFLSETHVRAGVPEGVPPGAYNVELYNPENSSNTFSSYFVLDGLLADDLFSLSFDMFTIPASPREGDPFEIGVVVRRRTGDFAALAGGPVNVDVELSAPAFQITGSDVINPNTTISMTFLVAPTLAGDYTVTINLTSPELIIDTVPANNTVTRTITVQPPSTDAELPVISALTLDNDPNAMITFDPEVVITTTASDTGGSGLAYIYYIEYAFDRGLGDWMPVKRSPWLPFTAASTNFTWLLEPTPGVHFIQAWVSDFDGNVSSPAGVFINFIPPKNTIVHHGGQVFRFFLNPGVTLQIDLTSLTGDADMFAWDSNENLVDAAFGFTPFEQIVINSGINPPGIYQVDVYGFEAASYWFEVSQVGTLQGPEAIQGHLKPSDIPLQVVENNPGQDVDVPSPPGGWSVYLPVIVR